MSQRYSTAEEIARGASDIVRLIVPERDSVFADRARRLRQLADGHSMAGYLNLIASVIEAQAAIIQDYPGGAVRLPDARALSLAREHGMPPLVVRSWQRDASWQVVLRGIASRLAPALDGVARATADRVKSAAGEWLEEQANIVLNGLTLGLDRGAAVFVAAALQVYWTHMLLTLPQAALTELADHPSVCPCCGSRPVASIVKSGGQSGLRYLACSLCALQWHFVRITCANCASNKAIQYFNVDGTSKAVRAEACDDCDTYLKIIYAEDDPLAEPAADDLATINLDLLMAERTHFLRSAVNLALFHGESGD
jgi:FdhE protein